MGWSLKCSACGKTTGARNIVDLLDNHRDESGWFRCSYCDKPAYIEKSFDLQEPGEIWEPFLRGAISLANKEETYQPFVFLVSGKQASEISGVWFSYYKDLRISGGRLKLGYGPGGPPVLDTSTVLDLLGKLIEIGCLTKNEVTRKLDLLKSK